MPERALRPNSIQAVVVEVGCPGCRDAVPNPWTGSHLWEVAQVREQGGEHGVVGTCECGLLVLVKLPQRVVVA